MLLGTSAATGLAERFFAEGETLQAPHLLDADAPHPLPRMVGNAE